MAGDRRQLVIRAIAAQASVQVSIRESTGANCALCLEVIARGSRQYEIDIGQSTVIVDENCYTSSLQDIVDTHRDSE